MHQAVALNSLLIPLSFSPGLFPPQVSFDPPAVGSLAGLLWTLPCHPACGSLTYQLHQLWADALCLCLKATMYSTCNSCYLNFVLSLEYFVEYFVT